MIVREYATRAAASNEVRGAAAVARTFAGRARVAQPALVNGAVGLVWHQAGEVVAIGLVADPERRREIDLVGLDG